MRTVGLLRGTGSVLLDGLGDVCGGRVESAWRFRHGSARLAALGSRDSQLAASEMVLVIDSVVELEVLEAIVEYLGLRKVCKV